MKNLKNVREFVGGINKGTFGITMVTATEPKMRKTSNRFFGRVVKLTYTTNVALGYDYASYIVAKLKREGIVTSVEEVRAEKPKGKTWFENPYLLVADKDETQFYLRCYYRPNTKEKNVWLVDGRLATDEEIAEVKTFIQTSSSSKKQSDLGLSDENQVIVRDYKLENVLALTQGEKVYNKIGSLVSIGKMREFFGMF